MNKRRRKERLEKESLILFGEGPSEALFLELFRSYYSDELSNKNIDVGNAHGGSPQNIFIKLNKEYLQTGNSETPCLVLMDSDIHLDEYSKGFLKTHSNVKVVYSAPQCIEGLFLTLLDDQLVLSQQNSKKFKTHFQKNYLKTNDSKILVRLKYKREQLFPKALIESKVNHVPQIKEILEFLGVNKED